MNVKQLAGIALVSTIVVSCTACSTITRIAYHKTAYEFYNPSLHNDTITITGSKPEELVIKGTITFNSCSKYDSYRIYENIEAEDYGTTYKIEMPIIVDDINDTSYDNCNNISLAGLSGYFKYGNKIIPALGHLNLLSFLRPENDNRIKRKLNLDINENMIFYCADSDIFKTPYRLCENKDYSNKLSLINLQNKKEIHVNFGKGKYWDEYYQLSVK